MRESIRFDVSPRRVWLGMTIPGKKMARMLATRGFERGRGLVELYQRDAPYRVLLTVALALHILPQEGAYGPAFKDLRQPLHPGMHPGMLFGALLTDIRDFLKLRFRASGLPVEPDQILKVLRAGVRLEGLEPVYPEVVVNYTVSALDALSRDIASTLDRDDFVRAVTTLKDLLRETAELAIDDPQEKKVWDAGFQT